jgi:hypothetical protein
MARQKRNDGLTLDAVIEGVAAPSSDASVEAAIWPESLRAHWSPRELPGRADDDRRAWQVRDPQGDLDITVIWTPAAPQAEEEGAGGGALLYTHLPRAGSRGEDLLRTCELALRHAEQLGLKLYDPVLDETFETEDWAFRLTEPFHARGWIATHWVASDDERASWVHIHGMDRFGLPDVEAFEVSEDRAGEVVAFLHEVAATWIREEAPAPSPSPRRLDGVRVRVLDAAVGRRGARGWDDDGFQGHDGAFLTLSPLETWSEALQGWRPSSIKRTPGLVERLCAITGEILPRVRQRFEEGGAEVTVKARFKVAAPSGLPSTESMWVKVDEWLGDRIKGRLANEPELRGDLACGAEVEVAAGEVWDVLVVEDGRPYQGVSLRRHLRVASE